MGHRRVASGVQREAWTFHLGKKKRETARDARRETAKKDRRRTEKSYLREKRARACVCVLWCGAVGKSTHEPAPVFVLLSLSTWSIILVVSVSVSVVVVVVVLIHG